jgi:GTP-binding protein
LAKFIDEVPLRVVAGHGGPGAVSFLHEKFLEFGGPDGGDGGRGGNVVLRSQLSIQTLDKFIPFKVYKAGAGTHGGKKNKSGKAGEDLILKVPVGTQVYDLETNELLYDFLEDGQEFIVVKGGRGGKGNSFFKSSTMQTPRFAQEGEEGESKEIKLNLKLLADVGLVGLPNAGKSTLLSKITDAHPKIANYAFTTLSPNLGVVKRDDDLFRYTIADIPGIIEGASKGHGLGLSFLRHIERVKGIIYLLDITSVDVLAEYEMLQNELKSYNKKLLKKKSIIVLNKIDEVEDDEYSTELSKKFKKKNVIGISAIQETHLEELLILIDKVFFGKKSKSKRKKNESQ